MATAAAVAHVVAVVVVAAAYVNFLVKLVINRYKLTHLSFQRGRISDFRGK